MSKHAPARQYDEAIAELTRQGHPAHEIARRLDVTPRTVQRARRRTGTSLPSSPNAGRRYTPEFIATVNDCLDQGWSYHEIARTYGVNDQHLAKRFPGRGWTTEQSAQLAVVRKAEIRLYRALDNQHRNATHLLPLADVL